MLSVVLSSCVGSDDIGERHLQHSVAGAQTFYLTPQALKDTELAARRGSADAAVKLSEYHGFVRLDLEQQIYWLRKAVKGGAEDERENLETLLETQAERKTALRRKASAAP